MIMNDIADLQIVYQSGDLFQLLSYNKKRHEFTVIYTKSLKDIPEWAKAKISILDLMPDINAKLPCNSSLTKCNYSHRYYQLFNRD